MPKLQPSPAIAPCAASPEYTPKQAAILQGAMQVFLRSGYAGTTMDQVAVEAGVSKQTIYSHFQDKEGLFTALMERMTIRRFQAVLGMPTLQGEPEQLLRQFAEGFLNQIVDAEYVAWFRLIIAESARFPELAQLYGRTVIHQGRKLLTEYFQHHPELRFVDAAAVAHIFIGSLVSYVLAQEIFDGKTDFPLDRDRLVDSLLALILSQR